MTVKEAAQFLRISERTIRAQLASKQWPGYRCGAAVRVDPLELKARMKRAPFGGKPSRSRPRSVAVNPSADLP
ncbi:MAG: helix-turn-helix domain-containing protein [Nitrospira sp.]|nr:helix-turn-helix domain-containing protein [Nitrospira sp.]